MATLIDDVFAKLRTSKNVVRPMSKTSCLMKPFEKQDGKPAKTFVKFQRQQLYQIYLSLSG